MTTKQYDNYADLITFSRASSGTALSKISYGPELVTNGTFDTDTSGWTNNGMVTFEVQSGRLRITANANADNVYQDITTVTGKTYVLSFDYEQVGGDGLFDGSGVQWINGVISGTGSITHVFVGTGTDRIQFQEGGSTNNADFYLDNISVKEVLFDQPDGTLTLFNHPTNVPRIEYDASGNRKGLLVEEARTNLITYSEAFENWSVFVGASRTGTNIAAAPDGTDTADGVRLTLAGTNSNIYTTFASGALTANTYTFSVWVKRNAATDQTFQLFQNIRGATPYGFSGDLVATSEWQRFTFTHTETGGTSASVIGIIGNTSGTQADILVWGAQLEAGSFPTSYIPTSGSTATRSADVASIPTSAFGYNQKAGTVVVDVNTFDTDYSNWVWVLDGTSDTSVYGHSAANGWRVFGAGGTVSYLGSLPTNADAQIGYAYSNVGSATLLDGGSVSTAAHSQPVAVTTMRLGAASTSAGFLNGHIKSIAYYPRRLSNAQLQELTA